MNVGEALDLYFDWCEANRAPKTVRAYRQRLRTFRDRFGGRQWDNVKPHEIHRWIAESTTNPDGSRMAPDTIRATITAFERLQKWLVEEQELVDEPITKKSIEKPRGRFREAVLTDEQIERIVRAARLDFRRIYLAYLLSGARPYELAEAEIADWRRDEGAIVLQKHKTARKTGKPRVIPVGGKLAGILEESVAGRSAGPLFLDRHGKAWSANRLSAQFRSLRDRLGLPKELVLYTARHTHATRLLERCKDLKAVGDALGHTQISTTTRYVHKDLGELRGNQDQLDFGDEGEDDKAA